MSFVIDEEYISVFQAAILEQISSEYVETIQNMDSLSIIGTGFHHQPNLMKHF